MYRIKYVGLRVMQFILPGKV